MNPNNTSCDTCGHSYNTACLVVQTDFNIKEPVLAGLGATGVCVTDSGRKLIGVHWGNE